MMDNSEFFYHLNIIKDMLKKPHVRIILLHNPYTKQQQGIIDTISSHSKHIIGQLERTPPLREKAFEIQRLIASHSEPFISQEKIQYVVLGQQKPKIKKQVF